MVQFISHYTEKYTYLDSIQLALEGGCRWIQLRMKDASDQELLDTAKQAFDLCQKYGATFIIDDNVLAAKQVGAHGVHLGKNDMPINEARKILGPNAIIGGTANTFDDICAHVAAGANYIGCGPFRFTSTKKNLSSILGLEGYQNLMSACKKANFTLPIVAIGGITADDIPSIMQTGVSGIAISSEVLRANNPVEKMQQIIKQVTIWKH
jgi:thiamine-phosphate pyrophosphorylase